MEIGIDFVRDTPVVLSPDDRARHLHLIGATGTGKTSTLLNLMRQDIEEGAGLAFIDPHGDAARSLLDFVPKRRIRDVVFLDPSDIERPVGFNPLEVRGDRAAVADGIVAAFRHVFGDSWGPRLEHFLLNACRTLLENEGSDLLGIPLLFLDEGFRAQAVRKVKDPVVRLFWELEFPTYSERLLSEALAPVFNKINRVLAAPLVRNILCQQRGIDIRQLMDEGRILIVGISKGHLGEGNAHLLGALLVTAIAQAALSREDTPEKDRRPFHLYVDEFQNFATDSFGVVLSEARKYALTLTLAHQFLDQLPERLRLGVLGNCGSTISFRLGAQDAPTIARHLGLGNPAALSDLQNYRAIARLLVNGNPRDPVHLAMTPAPRLPNSNARQIVAYSRNRRGGERRKVEKRIERFLGRSSGKTAVQQIRQPARRRFK
jgi:hypothetical protein